MSWSKHLLISWWFVLLAACGDSEMVDLKEYVAQMNARKNTDVPPLPEFKHIPSYFYEVDKMRDPFMPFLEQQQQQHLSTTEGTESPIEKDCPRPDPYRVRVGLELIPLDSLRMVGTLREETKQDELWGLVMANDGTLYRVHTGDYIGLNSGKVIGVYEDRIELMELLPDKEGCFTETATQIALPATETE